MDLGVFVCFCWVGCDFAVLFCYRRGVVMVGYDCIWFVRILCAFVLCVLTMAGRVVGLL